MQQGFGSVEWRVPERLSVSSVEEPPAARYPQRGRALSDSDIRLDPRRPCARAATLPAPALSELEESDASAPRKKGPPRPPPPDWEQFHRRRASQHNLLSSSQQNLLSPAPSPPKDGNAPELTRPRSHSLPPGAGPESRPERSPAFPRGAFRPLAPPLKEYDLPLQHLAPPTPALSEPYRT